jgi:hypothetical protein
LTQRAQVACAPLIRSEVFFQQSARHLAFV